MAFVAFMMELLQSKILWGIVMLVALGFTPSLIWLAFYLKQDDNPEPKPAIIRVFFYGFISTFVAFALEWGIIGMMESKNIGCAQCGSVASQIMDPGVSGASLTFAFFFLALLALTEEWVKYIASRIEIARSRFFDEPVDAMIYLIIAALGFAAAENIGYIMQNPENALGIAYFRFLSSTSLHALSSAIVGYFLMLSVIHKRSKLAYLSAGIASGTLLHTAFNFLIITSEQQQHATLSLIALMLCAFFIVSLLFKSAKRLSFKNAKF